MRKVEVHGLGRKERRERLRRWRKERRRSVPSPSATFRFLAGFHEAGEACPELVEREGRRVKGKAFIPRANEALRGLGKVNGGVVRFLQQRQGKEVATLA
jgi:hypothetical protein